LAAYAATIEALDQNIGRIWALLDALDLAGTTYLMLTSDNGATHSYTAPLRDGKGTLYEGGIRVPAFMVGPGIPPGSENDTPISSIDFFPTIAELAGAKSASFDGESLVPLLLHGEDLRREALFWHFPCYVGRGVPASAIRIGDWKLIEFFETQTVEVYNLAEDPGESRDLAAIDPEHTRELRDKLKAWQRITQAPCPIERNPNYDPNASLLRGRNRRGQQRQTTEAER
jgi:arylsulfatase A-like enzyme